MKWMENGDKQKANNNIKPLHLLNMALSTVSWMCIVFVRSFVRFVHFVFCFLILCVSLLSHTHIHTQNVHTTFSKCCGHGNNNKQKYPHTKWNGCNSNNQFRCQERGHNKVNTYTLVCLYVSARVSFFFLLLRYIHFRPWRAHE